jgi:hypothetical protein
MFDSGVAKLILRLSWQSMLSHRVKTFVVGFIIFFGVFLLVLTDALMTSINQGMSSSITSSITGDLQIYDSRAEDRLSLTGTMGNFMTQPNLGSIPDFEPVKNLLETHPNVRAIVPMGTDTALIFQGNTIDQLVTDIRQRLLHDGSRADIRAPIEQLRTTCAQIKSEYTWIAKAIGSKPKTVEALENLLCSTKTSGKHSMITSKSACNLSTRKSLR